MAHPTKPLTKAALVRNLLAQPGGATIEAICAATGWQPHSARASLSVIRKGGARVERLAKVEGESASRYRLLDKEVGLA